MTDSPTTSADLTALNTPVCAARWWPYPPREYGKDGYPVTGRFIYGCALDSDMNATLGVCALHGCGTRCRCPFLPEDAPPHS